MTQLATPTFDKTRAEAFAGRLLGTLNQAALSLMISIGHRTNLFGTLKELEAATSEEVAQRAGLNERYVREWLAAMTTGRVVEFDPQTGRYHLPAEHAAFLTPDAGPDNIANTTQWIAVLGRVEDEIIDKFRGGGGVHYRCFHRFHEVMASESAQTVVAALRDHILPLVPNLIDDLERGIEVLDVGCGSGRAMNHLAGQFPNSRFTGYDLCDDAIAAAKKEAAERGLTNVTFEARDVTDLGNPESFDVITAFDAIHDQKAPDAVLRGIRAALRPGGTFLMQDIRASSHLHKNMDHPLGTFFYTISTMHCMTVSLAQGGAGLGTCWGEELACDMLADAGFANVEVKTLPHDIINNYYIAQP